MQGRPRMRGGTDLRVCVCVLASGKTDGLRNYVQHNYGRLHGRVHACPMHDNMMGECVFTV